MDSVIGGGGPGEKGKREVQVPEQRKKQQEFGRKRYWKGGEDFHPPPPRLPFPP